MRCEYIVELEDVCLVYNTPSDETIALESVSFGVKAGEFIGVVGPSGCGKSTILSLICGLMKPTSGHVRLIGGDIIEPSGHIAYMLQKDHLFDWRTIAENVMIGLEVQKRNTPEAKENTLSLLDQYGLGEFKHKYPRHLSGGMRQKVALIRTLALQPEVLLLDEPFSSLDYQTRLAVSDEIHDIIKKENKTAIMVTHDIAEAVSMSDRVIVLSYRPARVKHIHTISLKGDTPIQRRSADGFKEYFDTIWKELDIYV